MKKTLLFLGLASVMLGFTGCAKDDATNGGNDTTVTEGITAPETLVASMGDGATRTALVDGKALWTAGDNIAIYGGRTSGGKLINITYALETGANTATASFKKTATSGSTFAKTYLGAYGDNTAPAEGYLAVYPAENTEFVFWGPEDMAAAIRVPSTQNYTPNTYDPKALTMVSFFQATGETISPLKFKYANALLCMPIVSAASQEIDQIVIYGTKGADLTSLAGKVQAETHKSVSETTVKALVDNYTNMATSFQPSNATRNTPDYKEGTNKVGVNITLANEDLSPMTFNATPTNVYVGILPSKFSDTKIHVEFRLFDGSKFEKIAPGKDVEAGNVLKLPLIDATAPYIPTTTFAPATKVISWVADNAATSYVMDVQNNLGDIILSKPIAAGATTFDVNTLTEELSSLDVTIIPVGKPTPLQLTLKAVLASNAAKNVASYSIPVEYSFTRAAIQIAPIIKVTPGEVGKEADYNFAITNYKAMKDNNATINIKYVEKENAVYPGDFATGAKVVPVTNNRGVYPYEAWSDYKWERGKHYTYVCEVSYDNAAGTPATVLHTATQQMYIALPPAPTAIDAAIIEDSWMGTPAPSLIINNYKTFSLACPDLVINVYAKLGEDAVMGGDLATYEMFKGGYNSELNLDLGIELTATDFPIGLAADPSAACSFKIVATSSKLAGGSLTTVVVRKAPAPAVAPTELTLSISNSRGIKIYVDNADACMEYLNPNPSTNYTVYAKAGVGQNMDGIENDPNAPKMTTPNVMRGINVSNFPAGRVAGAQYTYKCVLTGNNLDSSKTLNISGVTDDSKVSNTGGM